MRGFRLKRADDPRRDYRRLVADGYDRCAAAYNAARLRESADVLVPLVERLEDGARVLDLGCGAGVPISSTLSQRFAVTGVDVSREQIALARAQAPRASFIVDDMTRVRFDDASFDAVVSFYAIFHLPRDEHEPMFKRIYSWLRPGGYFLATLANHDEAPYTEQGFFGVEMYWSNFGIATYREMLAKCGFEILHDGVLSHGYDDGGGHPPESHPLVFARKNA